jgi:Putative polyhydroxyalkanoic acid system protein (PHA_gran_rgn)
MEHRIEHDLSPELARKAVKGAVTTYSEKLAKYSPTVAWQGEDRVDVGFKAKGMTLSGTLKLVPKAVLVDMDVPLLLKPFRKIALDVIETQVKEWVAKAHAGEV